MNKANQGKKILDRIWEVWEAGMIKVTMTTHNQRKEKKRRSEKEKRKGEKGTGIWPQFLTFKQNLLMTPFVTERNATGYILPQRRSAKTKLGSASVNTLRSKDGETHSPEWRTF